MRLDRRRVDVESATIPPHLVDPKNFRRDREELTSPPLQNPRRPGRKSRPGTGKRLARRGAPRLAELAFYQCRGDFCVRDAAGFGAAEKSTLRDRVENFW